MASPLSSASGTWRLNPNQAADLRRFFRWLRCHDTTWSSATVSGIAIRTRADEWLGVGVSVVLGDSPAGAGVLASPVVTEADVVAFRVDLPSVQVRPLLRNILRGVIPAGSLPGVSVGIGLVVPSGSAGSGHLSFHEEQARPYYAAREVLRSWPCASLEVYGGTLREWQDGYLERHARLAKAERLFSVHYPGTLAELARKLCPRRDDFNTIWDARLGALFIAPLLARIGDVAQDRDADVLRIQVQFGRWVQRGKFKLVVGWSSGSRAVDRFGFSGNQESGPADEVCVPQPLAGQATVVLWLDGMGEVDKMTFEVHPPYKKWLGAVVLSSVDRDHERLRTDLDSAGADEFERGVAMLLGLLGYSAFWWSRKLALPAGEREGMSPDIVMFRADTDEVLVVECTTDQCSDAKVNKLHGRAERIRTLINQALGSNRVTVRTLLSIRRPRDQIAPAVVGAAKTNGGGLMSKSDALGILEMVAQGESRKAVMERFEGLFYSLEREKNLLGL
jgi:hypothetical protein